MSTLLRPANLLSALLVLVASGSLSAFLLERRTAAGLAQENNSLRGVTNEMQRLREDNQEVARLREENQELERLRNDNKDLYKLRNEVRELRQEKAAWEATRPASESSTRAAAIPAGSSSSLAPTVNSLPATAASPAAGSKKPWLGFYYVKIPEAKNPDNAGNLVQTGTLVSFIEPDSPAEKAGLQVNDVVVAFQSQPVQTVQDLINLSRKVTIGETVSLDVIREGASMQLQLLVAEKPLEQPK